MSHSGSSHDHEEEAQTQNEEQRSVRSQSQGTSQTSVSKTRKTRGQTPWPSDTMTVGKVNDQGIPMDTKIHNRLKRVCGLAARQRVPLNLPSWNWEEMDETERIAIYEECVQNYVIYPDHLKEKAIELSMKMISSCWRDYKWSLRGILKRGEDPFCKYKDLKQEDWDTFVTQCSTPEFQVRSQQMTEVRSHYKDPHRLGPSGYIGKKAQWEREDERLAQEGRENPYHKYPGRSHDYIRGRTKLSDNGEVIFPNSSTEEVAEKVLAAASEGITTGRREEDILSRALGNKESRGRVRGVSRYTTWEFGFPESSSTYRKRKTSSTNVDVETLTRNIPLNVLSALKPILDQSGIQIPEDFDIFSPTNLADHRSSHASASAVEGEQERTASPREDAQVSPARDEAQDGETREGTAACHSTNDPDSIDQLNQPTQCRLVRELGGYPMEVAQGLVFPNAKFISDDVPILPGFAVVKIDVVYENTLDIPLVHSSALLPALCALPSAYAIVGNESSTIRSALPPCVLVIVRPAQWWPCAAPERRSPIAGRRQ